MLDELQQSNEVTKNPNSPSWESDSSLGSQEILCIGWTLVGSLPYSQAPATCPYPRPVQSSLCLSIQLLVNPF